MSKLGFPLFLRPEAKLQNAKRLLEHGKARQGLRQLHTLATSGNEEAQFVLGELYLADKDVPINPGEALRWFQKAAEHGHAQACHKLAQLCYMGLGPASVDRATVFERIPEQGTPDYEGALHWAGKAVDGGDSGGMAMMAHLLMQGPENLRDPERGRELYRRAAEAGNVQGLYGYGLDLLGAAQNAAEREQGLSYIRRAAQAGLADAELTLGTVLEYEGGKDAQAFEHFMKAAEDDRPAAQMKVGIAYYQGRGVERDVSKAETWLRKAAQGGEVEAIALVGDINLQGDGVSPNFPEAHSWYRRAAESGHAGAAVTLAQLVYNGMGCAADPAEAKRLLEFAASRGNAAAKELLQRFG
ncbi:sel1 repeat family protein [Gluconobacter sp. Dm-74]|uniref:tetratricopeptide repeat protein n=1 Tax=Gluconobacter sp. Dm-74 TaxID=2799803 RepID=UPI001B8C6523|nr:tetratricopeptide repeat protein [Gluconobacter sp. Dm-74]MBS1091826.1 sel1 repeat family protein [Gluconobacter sp. Dm-74]